MVYLEMDGLALADKLRLYTQRIASQYRTSMHSSVASFDFRFTRGSE